MTPPSDLLAPFASGGSTWADGASGAALAMEDRVVVFRGEVSNALAIYGGDPAAARSAEGMFDLGRAAGIAIRARGDGRTYRLRLRTVESFAEVHYETELALPPGAWSDLRLPFEAFRPVWRWYEFHGHPLLDAAAITSFGLVVSRRDEGPFRLEVASLAAYGEAPLAHPERGARDARAWEDWLAVELHPRALDAAGLPRTTRPEDVFAGAVERRRDARIECYADAAAALCEGLVAFVGASAVARRSASRAARTACEAIHYLALEAAYERAIASDLLAVVPEGCSPTAGDVAREAAADAVFARWLSLDAPLRDSLARRGLALDPEDTLELH